MSLLLEKKRRWCQVPLLVAEKNLGTASWQESSCSPGTERERESKKMKKLIKPKGKEEYNALPCVHISRKLLSFIF